MKLRYLVVAGTRARRATLARRAGLAMAPDLGRRADGEELELWTPSETPVTVSDDHAAIVVGTIFAKTDGDPPLRPGGAIWTPAGLSAGGWGGYVAFGARPGGGHFVLRDPSGAVVAYHRRESGCEIYASDDDLLWRGARAQPAPDLDFIREWLTFPFLRGARTGVAGVRELLPGQSLAVAEGYATATQSWTPAPFLKSMGAVRDPADAVRRLRETLLTCIPRLIPENEAPFLKLSGGLDSSLVAAALARARIPFTAITFATADRDGDERVYARAVAAACGVELIELGEGTEAVGLVAPPRDRLRPPRHPLLQQLDHVYAQQWTAHHATLVLTGAGGDNVFAALPTAIAASDAWRMGGAGTAWRALANLAAVHDTTVWRILGHARRRTRRGAIFRWPIDARFLKPDAIAGQPGLHPWLEQAGDAPPGSIEHLRMITATWRFLGEQRADGPATLHPLLAQPIVELCLSIPSWMWVAGGRDRAIARAALADLLPEAVLQRRGKGGLGRMFRGQFESLARALGALLVDGHLADAGILDRGAVVAYLDQRKRWDDGQWLRLLDLVAAEQWLESFARS